MAKQGVFYPARVEIETEMARNSISERVLKLTCTANDMIPLAEACGFSGLERYTLSDAHQHVDSRVEYAYGSQSWWWESGTIS